MIKELIADLAYDKIQLSQALTRSKILSVKVNNERFKVWLKKELEGYSGGDKALPPYRKVFTGMKMTIEFPFGLKRVLPVLFEEGNEEIMQLINNHCVLEPISIIENNIQNLQGQTHGIIYLPAEQVFVIAKAFPAIENIGGALRNMFREIGKSQLQTILELTKQKLLDTLIELDQEFPDLINYFPMTEENKDKVQNIITNNIYGDNNPLNIAAGEKVEQKNINVSVEALEQELEKVGVSQSQIAELKEIILSSRNDKPSLQSRVGKWLATVAASFTAKGLSDQIPAITEFVHRHLNI